MYRFSKLYCRKYKTRKVNHKFDSHYWELLKLKTTHVKIQKQHFTSRHISKVIQKKQSKDRQYQI